MKTFHIVLVAPEGNEQVKCFKEIIILFKKSIEDCGYPCSFALNKFSHTSFNIIIGGHLLKYEEIPIDIKIILLQFEQLSNIEGPFNYNYGKILKRADIIWDFSKENISFLNDIDIEAQYLSIGYNEILEIIPKNQNKDIDILFYGSINKRRRDILNDIHFKTGIKPSYLFGAYNQERNNIISRAKLVVNIHYYDSQIFESVRISFLLNNNIPILSENSKLYPYPKVNLPLCEADNFHNAITNIFKNYKDFKENCNINYINFKNSYLMKDIMQNMIKEY